MARKQGDQRVRKKGVTSIVKAIYE